MKNIITLLVLLVTTQVQAMKDIPLDQQIGNITVVETTGTKILEDITEGEAPRVGRIEQIKNVITVAKDIIALGEQIYEIVKRGKPTAVISELEPISVVPRDPSTKEYVDPYELEGFSLPVERTFTAKITNGLGMEVVRFDYSIVYSYGGSWNGTGKYLTNVMIVPKNIKTGYGWDFNATMKLSGIMNHGSKANPVAGAMLSIKYQMSSWSAAFERNEKIHVTGNGELKTMR